MKFFLIFACCSFAQIQALQYEIQFEDDKVCVSKVIVEAREEIGLHRDVLPQVVIALKGGIITRLEADGREVEVEFPTGKSIYRPVDPEGELHKSVNRSDDSIELIIIQIKK